MTSKFKKNMRRSLDKRLKKGGANALTVFTLLFVFLLFCGITSGDIFRMDLKDALGLSFGMTIASAFGFYWGFFNIKSSNANSRRDDSGSYRWGNDHRHSTTSSSSIFASNHSSMNSTSSYSNPTNYSWSSSASANYHRR